MAVKLAEALIPGDVIALTGELGAGKTEFVRGLAAGLGVPEAEVASPSFALAYEYQGRFPLVHLDLYRLPELTPDFLPDLEEYLSGSHVLAVEWAERLGPFLPEDAVLVQLVITAPEAREITLTGRSKRGARLLHYLEEDRDPTAVGQP